MQTPKARTHSSDVPQKISPDTLSYPNSAGRIPKDGSPEVNNSPISEKKCPSTVTELEAQLSLLQEELKKAEDKLRSTESLKNVAVQDAEEAKKQLVATSAKLEELQKISQVRERDLKYKVDAFCKQYEDCFADLSGARAECEVLQSRWDWDVEWRRAELLFARLEIKKLELKLKSAEVENENMKTKLSEQSEEKERMSQKTEGHLCDENVSRLEMYMNADETLRSQACNSLAVELEKSNALANLLAERVDKLQVEMSYSSSCNGGWDVDPKRLRKELINQVKTDVGNLRSALDGAKKYVQTTLQIRTACELKEQEVATREAELKSKLKSAEGEIEDMKAKLLAAETRSQIELKEQEVATLQIRTACELKEQEVATREAELKSKLKSAEGEIEDMKAKLLAAETRSQIESEVATREAELKSKLKSAEGEIEAMKAKLFTCELKEQEVATREAELKSKLKSAEGEIEDMKAKLLAAETRSQIESEENQDYVLVF